MRQFKTTPNITRRDSISIEDYLKDINHYSQISAEEEARLADTIQKGGPEGEKAKAKLIEANLRFVVSVANQYHVKNVELCDLVSEGNIGLIKAAEMFDSTRGFKFITYAVWWVRQSIMSAISKYGKTIRLPINQQNLKQLYRRLQQEIIQTEQRDPTAEEFAKFADISIETASDVISNVTSVVSTSTPLGEDSDSTIGDMLSADIKTDKSLDLESLHKDLLEVMNNVLSVKEREILTKFFGLFQHETSLEEIGEQMGLTRERVRQIKEKAVRKLYHADNIGVLASYLG